jgi:hypothetical protein
MSKYREGAFQEALKGAYESRQLPAVVKIHPFLPIPAFSFLFT